MSDPCPACGSGHVRVFHHQQGVPVNSCLLLETREEAVRFPRGELELGFCADCGFIANRAFDPAMAEYSARYEETQGYSAHFREFARSLAQRWISRYDLHGRDILEIGCGKGEFLALMCEIGGNRGIGVDPGAVPERLESDASDRIRLDPRPFSEDYAAVPADAVVCRHTLEHIAPVREFLSMIRRTIGDRLDTVVLFELPDVLRVLQEVAFQDVYYEHCSYFSTGSVARLFDRCGFDVVDVDMAFGGQYILLEARPREHARSELRPRFDDDLELLGKAVDVFAEGFDGLVQAWRARLQAAGSSGLRVAVWGGGSKAVSFLTAVGAKHVDCAVDINPHKHGKFLAPTGTVVVSPARLVDRPPDLVIAMNEVYLEEIRSELDRLDLHPELVAV